VTIVCHFAIMLGANQLLIKAACTQTDFATKSGKKLSADFVRL